MRALHTTNRITSVHHNAESRTDLRTNANKPSVTFEEKKLARRRNVWVPPPSYHHSLEYPRDVDDDINSSKSPSTYIRTTLLLENIQILRISFSSAMWERPTANLAQRRSPPQRRRTRCKHFAQSFFFQKHNYQRTHQIASLRPAFWIIRPDVAQNTSCSVVMQLTSRLKIN